MIDSAPPEIPFSVSVEELRDWLKSRRSLVLIDVREYDEPKRPSIGGQSIPYSILDKYLDALDRESDIVAYCCGGGRSVAAVRYLRKNGFTRARNLRGGMIAWENEEDEE